MEQPVIASVSEAIQPTAETVWIASSRCSSQWRGWAVVPGQYASGNPGAPPDI